MESYGQRTYLKLLQKGVFVPNVKRIGQTLQLLERMDTYVYVYYLYIQYILKTTRYVSWGLGSVLIS